MNDREEFDAIYNRYFPKVYSYFSVCFDRDSAEDLAQETFVKVWNRVSRADYHPPDHIKAWVFRIAVNVKNDFLRGKIRKPDCAELRETDSALENVPEETELKVSVEAAFARLDVKEKELLLLKSFRLTSDEIGEMLRLPSSTVRSRIAAAKKRFQKALCECGVNIDCAG